MKLFIAIICIISIFQFGASAQSIGIGTAIPKSSAVLDVTSTNKGLLTPRMTTAQRNAIASPAKGLLVFDTDVNSFYFYNGSNWTNMASNGNGGSFSLPFEQSVNTGIPAFKINNSGIGAAIAGHSTNDFGVGLTGSTSAAFGWGINGFARSPLAIGIYANADSATALKAESKEGLAIDATSIKNSAIKASSSNQNPTISANNAVGTALTANASAASAIVATSTWNGPTIAAVKGISTGVSSAGLYGENNNATGGDGVVGVSSKGVGVRGTTNGDNLSDIGVLGVAATYNTIGVAGIATHSASYGVYAKNVNGTALYAESSGIGKAIEINGNLKIAGGSTNPSKGAVLTSDETGNAVWKPQKVAFAVAGSLGGANTYPSGIIFRVMFATELYDYGNNISVGDGAGFSEFVVPTSGIYQFNASAFFGQTGIESDLFIFKKALNGVETVLGKFSNTESVEGSSQQVGRGGSIAVSTSAKLLQGEKVFVSAQWANGKTSGTSFSSAEMDGPAPSYAFNGFLAFAD